MKYALSNYVSRNSKPHTYDDTAETGKNNPDFFEQISESSWWQIRLTAQTQPQKMDPSMTE